MNSFEVAFHNLLLKRIGEMADGYAASVVGGQCTSFEQYREQIGYLRALKDVGTAIEEILAEIRKG